jgi:hypothetical protein
MTAPKPHVIPILGAIVALGLSPRAARSEPQQIRFHLELEPRLLDYGLPYHPTVKGETQVGTIGRATFVWSFAEVLAIEAGVLGRLPFAHNIKAEVGALPILALVIHPFSEEITMRFGSLDIRHGYHAAIVDEARYGYGRSYQAAYNRGLSPDAQRDLGGDPFLPAEHGIQMIAKGEVARAEGFLDWQLLETDKHREKFAVGLLGEVEQPWMKLGLQFRLVHYGGELFTRTDPIRFAGLDPVRQPVTGAITLRLLPSQAFGWFEGVLRLELPFAYIRGRVIQEPGAPPANQSGVEAGADLFLFDFARAGYRFWQPIDRAYGFLSEDGDPIYAERRSHRAIVALSTKHGPAALEARLDLVFADEAKQVQYETLTVLRFDLDVEVWGAQLRRDLGR